MSAASRPAGAAAPAAPCIVYVASTSIYLANARLPLLQRMLAEGWRVVGVAPEDAFTRRLVDAGVEWHPLGISREIARPIRHLRALQGLTALYRAARPALVHHFTANPVIYGTVAAWRAGTPAVVNAFPGLGSVFQSTHWDAPFLRAWLRMAYRAVTRLPNSRTIFQNGDDREALVRAHVVPAANALVIRGAGVALEAFRPSPEPVDVPTVLFCGRMLQPKGVHDLVAAARLLRQWQVACRVRLVGRRDARHRGAVPVEVLRQWEREGLVTWDGQRDDMPAVFAGAHVVVLPSHGGEGVPRSLVEGAACGRPLVATDVAGCREVVVHERNGLLVPPRDPHRLALALARLLRDPAERQAFGRAGREIAGQFAQASVIAATLDVYRQLIADPLLAPIRRDGRRCDSPSTRPNG